MNSVTILYENNEIYIINKPAGLSVQGGQGVSHSLDNDFAKQVGQKVYLVHRLDKDTAGLMVVAKTSQAAGKWTNLIGSKAVKKEYIAICAGGLKDKKGIINDTVIQHGEKKTAVTHYMVEKQWDAEIYNEAGNPESGVADKITMSQVRLKLETGRMHQIRIHLAKQGCPIAGDDQHGNFKVNKILKKHLKIKRLQLTSVKLSLPRFELEGKKGEDVVFEIEADK